jgi:murein L,D-transpeptidase YcbB/YkuD
MKFLRQTKTVTAILTFFLLSNLALAQSSIVEQESARSDKLTGSKIEKTTLVAGDGNIEITVNVPAFQLTLWQNGKEVKTYPIGVGMKDYPIYIGDRLATEVIWNPNWIPPDSEWVEGSKNVKPLEVIKPTDPRNPLGKLKIPLGDGYLIHQAKGVNDLGELVSHGCVRMLKADLFDLGEKIVAARSLPVSQKQIQTAKLTLKTLAAKLDPPIPVEITYDTQVVEAGRLHVYPDVYEYNTNTVQNLRKELETSGVKLGKTSDKTLNKMIALAAAKKQFVVSVKDIEAGRSLIVGRAISVVTRSHQTTLKNLKSSATRKRIVSGE